MRCNSMKRQHTNNDNLICDCKSPYYYLSRYRTVLMGFAILWVVWFHSTVQLDFFHIDFLNAFFKSIKESGYGGVDIFLLVSGMGIYNSLEKNEISKYIKNRFKRITPVWYSFLIISIILGHFFFQIDYLKSEILGFVTYTGYWLDMQNQGNWYVYAIILFYLVSPVFHSLIKNSKNKLLTTIILVIISLLVSVAFIGRFRVNIFDCKLLAFSRVPIFIIGMYISSSLKNKPIKRFYWVIMLLCLTLGISVILICHHFLYDYMWSHGLLWYPFIIIAPTLSLLAAKFFDLTYKVLRPFFSLISIFGKASL